MPTHLSHGPERVRLAQMLAPLSMVTDLARAHPPEEAMRGYPDLRRRVKHA
jgi:hypothetical protein